jgi:hypothetical protein
VPAHPLLALQDVEFVDVQVRITVPPATIDEALAVNVTVGAVGDAAGLAASPPPPPHEVISNSRVEAAQPRPHVLSEFGIGIRNYSHFPLSLNSTSGARHAQRSLLQDLSAMRPLIFGFPEN